MHANTSSGTFTASLYSPLHEIWLLLDAEENINLLFSAPNLFYAGGKDRQPCKNAFESWRQHSHVDVGARVHSCIKRRRFVPQQQQIFQVYWQLKSVLSLLSPLQSEAATVLFSIHNEQQQCILLMIFICLISILIQYLNWHIRWLLFWLWS